MTLSNSKCKKEFWRFLDKKIFDLIVNYILYGACLPSVSVGITDTETRISANTENTSSIRQKFALLSKTLY